MNPEVEEIMINKVMFFEAMITLLFSWGGYTPADAVWAANEFLDFYEKETGEVLGFRIDEDEDKNKIAYEKINSFLEGENKNGGSSIISN